MGWVLITSWLLHRLPLARTLSSVYFLFFGKGNIFQTSNQKSMFSMLFCSSSDPQAKKNLFLRYFVIFLHFLMDFEGFLENILPLTKKHLPRFQISAKVTLFEKKHLF